jgi:group II intron reverse transcriptase/maturase
MKAHQKETKFHNGGLLEEICEIHNMKLAFKLVKRNKGAPGIDGITIDVFEENLDQELEQLKQDVLRWTYKPTPVKRIEIPKPNGKGVRLLGIPTIKDRVLHMAIKRVLEPLIDPSFSNGSYGFRPGRSPHQAVKAAQEIVKSGKEFIVDIDLSKFFDRINHDRLIYRLSTMIEDKRVLRLIGMILRSGIMKDKTIMTPKEGSVQGSPLSPILSNVVLDELDKELEKRGLEFCRYADDCNIFVKTEKAAERVMESIKKFIEKKLKLKVNEEKSQVAKSDRVKFLGMTIVDGGIAISKAAVNNAMEKVKLLTPRGSHLPIEKAMKQINIWFMGWASYFKMTQYPAQLAAIEAHVRRRLRARIAKQQKKRRNLYRKLTKQGVNKKHAARTVYSNKGIWNLSHTRAVEIAFPNRWFKDVVGQKIFSNLGLTHWHPVKEWVKLT